MPVADNKFIKIFNEGEANIKEVNDGNTNMDMTIEYEFQKKMGVATIVGKNSVCGQLLGKPVFRGGIKLPPLFKWIKRR